MYCYVYKATQKDGLYLYLPAPADQQLLASLPAALTNLLGDLTLVTEFDLTEKKLVQAEAKQVMEDLCNRGFYLQMPNRDTWLEEHRYFN